MLSTTIISELVMVSESSSSSSTKNTSSVAQIEIESTKCNCCGLTEECTPAYIEQVRERYGGKWICGLCAEAVKDEIIRSERLISTEEALARHLNVCRKFRTSWPPATDPTLYLITAVGQILRRSLECPRGVRSTPASPMRGDVGDAELMKIPVLMRSESLFSELV